MVMAKYSLVNCEDIKEVTPDLLKTILGQLRFNSPISPVQGIKEFFANQDHGFSHSTKVWRRCQTLVEQCPNLCKCFMASRRLLPNDAEEYLYDLLLWSSIFHDFCRFCGCDFSDHQVCGADLAVAACRIMGKEIIQSEIRAVLYRHDYLGQIVDGDLPLDTQIYPIAELFRLADKTSVSPIEEVERYWQTAKRYKTMFFDPTIPDEVRFNLAANEKERTDSLTWILLIFALQSTDFLFAETADAYAYWARGKRDIFDKLRRLAAIEGCNGNEVVDTVRRFISKYELLMF